MDSKVEEVQMILDKSLQDFAYWYDCQLSDTEERETKVAKQICALFKKSELQDTAKPLGCRLWNFSGDCPQYGSAECPASCSRYHSNPAAIRQVKQKEQDADLREIILRNKPPVCETCYLHKPGTYTRKDCVTYGKRLCAAEQIYVDKFLAEIAAAGWRPPVTQAQQDQLPKLEEPELVLTNEERVQILRTYFGTPSEVEVEAVRSWVTLLLEAQRDADRKHCPAQQERKHGL